MRPLVGMDVLPRRAEAEAAEVAEPVQEMPADIEVVEPTPEPEVVARPAEAPAEEVNEPVEAPKESSEADTDEEVDVDEPEEPVITKPTVPKAPRQPGVTLAIVATVIIVLGLATLIVYAYLQSPEAGVL